ncbi:MAG TPA: hypothetical protein ACHBX0_15065 [Arsenophonus sp.]
MPITKDSWKDSRDGSMTLSQNGELLVKPQATERGNYGKYYCAIHEVIK